MVTLSFAWPGVMNTGAVTVRPWYFRSTLSSVLRPSFCAVAGLTQAALSHVILFCGLGSSCSQPLFDHDPSQRAGSGRIMISRPCDGFDSPADGALAVTLMAASAVFGTTPSCNDFCQKISNVPVFGWLCQYSWTNSCGVLSG